MTAARRPTALRAGQVAEAEELSAALLASRRPSRTSPPPASRCHERLALLEPFTASDAKRLHHSLRVGAGDDDDDDDDDDADDDAGGGAIEGSAPSARRSSGG